MNKKRKQFIYVLKLIPDLLDEKNWTKREETIVEKHFSYLQGLLGEGKLVLAGKTDGLNDKTFGIVILETDTAEEARLTMENDPAVKDGIIKAELFPYRVALINNSF